MGEIDNPGNQSLVRALTDGETALSDALFAIFGQGVHDFGQVAEALNQRGVSTVTGEPGAWTAEKLEKELSTINRSLDEAYCQGLPEGAGL